MLSQETKESRLKVGRKMDSVNLTGVWLNFPAAAGRLNYAAGLYLQELLDYRRARRLGERPETAHEVRMRLLKVVEQRIMREDVDDLVMILAV